MKFTSMNSVRGVDWHPSLEFVQSSRESFADHHVSLNPAAPASKRAEPPAGSALARGFHLHMPRTCLPPAANNPAKPESVVPIRCYRSAVLPALKGAGGGST